MITQEQLKELSSYFQIDKTIIFREYLQLLFLNYLYKEKISEKIYFKGGTCLHLLYFSPRFSEDLDFSTTLSKNQVEKLIKKIIEAIKKEVGEIDLKFLYSGKDSLRYKIKYQGKELKFPLTFRVDFHFEKIFLKPKVSKIETKFPVAFPSLVNALTKEEILTEKIRAFLIRAKGRDIFDLWFLFSENTPLKGKILEKKLKSFKLKFNPALFLKKLKNYPQKTIERDLSPFLPKS
jgi:predicted nucleotidyltransferase component of viral defense system